MDRGVIEIDLLDLIRSILKYWRVFIIAAVIGALAGSAFNAIKYYKEFKAKSDPENAYSEEDIKVAEDAFAVYKASVIQQEALEKKLANPIYEKINSDHVPRMRVQYHISGTKDVSNIISSFGTGYIMDLATCEKIAEVFDIEKEDASFVKGLVWIGNESGDTTTILPIEGNTSDEDLSGIFSFTVTGFDEDSCQKMAGIIEEQIDKRKEELKKIYGDFKLEKTGSLEWIDDDTSFVDAKVNLSTQVTGIYDRINNIKTKTLINDDQKAYFETLVKEYEEGGSSEEDKDEKSGEEMSVKEMLFSKKALFIGIFLGICLVGAIIVIGYCIDGHIKCDSEIKDYFGIPVISYFGIKTYRGKKKNIIDELIDKIGRKRYDGLSTEEKNRLLCTDISATLKKKEYKTIHMILSENEEKKGRGDIKAGFDMAEKLCSEIETLVGSEGIKVTKGITTAKSVDSLENLLEKEAVVFISVLNLTRREDMEKDIRACKKYEKEVLGAVVIET